MIAYKVVERKTRCCSNIALYKADIIDMLRYMKKRKIPTDDITLPETLMKKYPTLFPVYLKGTKVRARKGSVGIMAFDSKESAKDFRNDYLSLRNNSKIIRVEGIQKLKPSLILQGCGTSPDSLVKSFEHGATKISDYNNGIIFLNTAGPAGILFFKAVRVLD